MAEFVVFVEDRYLTGDPIVDSQKYHAGDVVVVCENGWPWGGGEQQHEFWRIIKMPEVSTAAASILVAPELPSSPSEPNRTLHKRMYKINLNHPALREHIMAPRASPYHTVTGVAFDELYSRKPSISDPSVI